MQVNVNISDGIVYFSADKGEATIEPETLALSGCRSVGPHCTKDI